MADASAAEEAGAFAMVLECIPRELAKKITAKVKIPTIGIGAGADCDGQVLVLHDLLGITTGYMPKFVKAYADLKTEITGAVTKYRDEVRDGIFPDKAAWVRLIFERWCGAVAGVKSLPAHATREDQLRAPAETRSPSQTSVNFDCWPVKMRT